MFDCPAESRAVYPVTSSGRSGSGICSKPSALAMSDLRSLGNFGKYLGEPIILAAAEVERDLKDPVATLCPGLAEAPDKTRATTRTETRGAKEGAAIFYL
mmetsp:Transcript_131/g.225  ORF Transcript_131/g.225 Transcript_131/m.225 type:complete len:100 (-) Transcript_131:2-301(-)